MATITLAPQAWTLIGVALGAMLGFLANVGLESLRDCRRAAATRRQLLALLRIVERQMQNTVKLAIAPIERWRSIDSLSERIFSSDSTSVLKSRAEFEVYELVTKLHQVRAGIERAKEQCDKLKTAMAGAEFWQTGPPILKQRVEELQAAAARGVTICKESRKRLGDQTPTEGGGSNLGRDFDDLQAERLAEIEAQELAVTRAVEAPHTPESERT